jgi:hypothetical protein
MIKNLALTILEPILCGKHLLKMYIKHQDMICASHKMHWDITKSPLPQHLSVKDKQVDEIICQLVWGVEYLFYCVVRHDGMVQIDTHIGNTIIVFVTWLCQIGFAHSFAPQIQTAVSPSILDRFTWNLNCTLSYMYSLCLIYNKFNHCSIWNSCFWVPGVIFVI